MPEAGIGERLMRIISSGLQSVKKSSLYLVLVVATLKNVLQRVYLPEQS